MGYVAGYHNSVLRLLQSVFVQLPLEIWFRFITAYVPSSTTFVNYSSATTAELSHAWATAQQQLATSPFPMSAAGGNNHPADPRALTVQPEHVTVVSVPDVPISDLTKIDPAWSKDKDPSGAILLNSGTSYTTCHAFTCTWRKPRVYAATSEIPNVLTYEFQNIILSKLGYDVSQR